MTEWRKEFHEEEYRKGQEAIAREVAAQDLEAKLSITKKVGTLANETFEFADELAASEDPRRQELAELIKSSVIGALKQGGEPGPRVGREPEAAAPFLDSSPPSQKSLPDSPPKALPHEPTEPPKRGRGRPRKDGKV
jgi:hypothetical protein